MCYHCSASSYAETDSLDDFRWHITVFNASNNCGTSVEVGVNEYNAVTSVIEITVANECASGVDLTAESKLVYGEFGDADYCDEWLGGTGEEDTTISAPLHAVIVCEGATCSGESSEIHGMHELNGATTLDADETRHAEITGGYYRTVCWAFDDRHVMTFN